MTGDDLWKRVVASVRRLGSREPRQGLPALEIIPAPRSLDLHGLTVDTAHQRVKAFLSDTTYDRVTIITGKSGVIRREFAGWLNLHPRVRTWSVINGDGAFSVWVK